MENILETKNLYGGYGKLEILHGIDLFVREKEIVTMLGPNGSGKSTFIKVVYGLATYHSGEIHYTSTVNGERLKQEISKLKANDLVKMGIGYVPQLHNTFPNMTIEENIEMGGYTLTDEEMEKGKELVYKTYPILAERTDHLAKTLSGGQRQMLALARALITDPNLIILDEPSAALQPSLVLEIMRRIKDLRDNQGVSVLIVEQNAKSSLRIADRGYILAAGRLVHTNTGQELLNNTDLASYYLGTHEKKMTKK